MVLYSLVKGLEDGFEEAVAKHVTLLMNSLLRSVNTHICKYTRTHTEHYICDYKDDVFAQALTCTLLNYHKRTNSFCERPWECLAALGHQPSQGLAQPTQIQLHNHPWEVLQCAFSVDRRCRWLWSVTRH